MELLVGFKIFGKELSPGSIAFGVQEFWGDGGALVEEKRTK